MRKNLIMALMILSVAAAACGPKSSGVVQPEDQATLPPEAAASEAPQAEPAGQAADDVFFEDDFSDPASGWVEAGGPMGNMGYGDGGYHISVIDPLTQVVSVSGKSSYENVVVDVDASRFGEDGRCTGEGCQVSTYGLICRYQDDNNFYGAGISGNYHGFFEMVDGNLLYFGMPGLFSSGEIGLNPGDASNHLRLICDGTSLAFYLNDQLLDEVFTDSPMAGGPPIASGDVGLYVRSSSSPTDILFDNFQVKSR